MRHEDSEHNSYDDAVPPGRRDESGTPVRCERRKRYPGILSKLASGSPEDAAAAVLKGELALHGVDSWGFGDDDIDTARLSVLPDTGEA